jgi:hypothetical protein
MKAVNLRETNNVTIFKRRQAHLGEVYGRYIKMGLRVTVSLRLRNEVDEVKSMHPG